MSVNSVVFSLEGRIAYDDDTRAEFCVTLDADGTVVVEGESAALADAIVQVKSMFTALGGSLTCSPTVSGKTGIDVVTRMEGLATIADAQKKFFAEHMAKADGTFVGSGANTDYAAIVAVFKTDLQTAIAALAGVSATIT